jgi:hypothetical protein
MTRAAKKPATTAHLNGWCGLILRLRPSNIDEAAIRRVLGKRCVRTLQELAKEFGVSATTLRANWRQQGMPGRGGAWPLADILIWRLRHEAAIAPRLQADQHSERLRQIEVEKAEADLRKRLRDEDRDEGRTINRDTALAATGAIIGLEHEMLAQIGPRLEPRLPLHLAKQFTVELNREINRVLHWLAEQSAHAISADVHEFTEVLNEFRKRRWEDHGRRSAGDASEDSGPAATSDGPRDCSSSRRTRRGLAARRAGTNGGSDSRECRDGDREGDADD